MDVICMQTHYLIGNYTYGRQTQTHYLIANDTLWPWSVVVCDTNTLISLGMMGYGRHL